MSEWQKCKACDGKGMVIEPYNENGLTSNEVELFKGYEKQRVFTVGRGVGKIMPRTLRELVVTVNGKPIRDYGLPPGASERRM